MKRLYSNLNEEQRTIKARQMFFDSVTKYVKQNPNLRNNDVVDYFVSLKPRYRLALITTNTKKALEKILSAIKLSKLFDIVEASEESEKDDKIAVFNRFLKKYENPIVYVGSSRKDSFDYCSEKNINKIFANFENEEELESVESVHSLGELKEKIERL